MVEKGEEFASSAGEENVSAFNRYNLSCQNDRYKPLESFGNVSRSRVLGRGVADVLTTHVGFVQTFSEK